MSTARPVLGSCWYKPSNREKALRSRTLGRRVAKKSLLRYSLLTGNWEVSQQILLWFCRGSGALPLYITLQLRLGSSTQSSDAPMEWHGSTTQSPAGHILSLPDCGLQSLQLSSGRREDGITYQPRTRVQISVLLLCFVMLKSGCQQGLCLDLGRELG